MSADLSAIAERAPQNPTQTVRQPVLLIRDIFSALDCIGIRWSLLREYDDYADLIRSDIDCLLGPETSRARLVQAIRDECRRHDAHIVRCDGLYIVVCGFENDAPFFLHFDFCTQCHVGNVFLYGAEEVLASSRLNGSFRVPSSDVEFGAYLMKCIIKRSLTWEKARRLSRLYAASPEACARHIHRFWNTSAAEEIALLASAGDWVGIRKRLEEFRAGLVHRAALRSPAWAIKHTLNVIGRRVSHLRRPNGLHVALLGCDGAGKSTVITAMLDAFGVGFSNSAVHGFVPALMQRALHGSNRRTDTPHALEPRSAAVSIARALMYWFPYYSIGYVFRYVELARSTFILNDRHFVDVLVDKRRYRYGGPEWLLRTIWRLIPKPDVILLLDAPPAVLFARKTETSFAEVSRQCLAYRELAKSIPLIKIVNAERPLPAVLLQINRLLVAFLEERALSRM